MPAVSGDGDLPWWRERASHSEQACTTCCLVYPARVSLTCVNTATKDASHAVTAQARCVAPAEVCGRHLARSGWAGGAGSPWRWRHQLRQRLVQRLRLLLLHLQVPGLLCMSGCLQWAAAQQLAHRHRVQVARLRAGHALYLAVLALGSPAVLPLLHTSGQALQRVGRSWSRPWCRWQRRRRAPAAAAASAASAAAAPASRSTCSGDEGASGTVRGSGTTLCGAAGRGLASTWRPRR